MAYEEIIYEEDGPIGTLTLNRPKDGNMFTPKMCHEIRDCINEVRRETRTRVLVLTGAGDRFFCLGGRKEGMEDTQLYAGTLPTLEMYESIDRLQKPVIASVNGYAVGGGNVLQMVCDLTIAADNCASKALNGSASMAARSEGFGNAISRPPSTEPIETVWVTSSIPRAFRKLLATRPSATRAAVSRADARSKTGLESRKPYFCIPVKSACPGRGLVSASARAPVSLSCSTGSADITSCHLGHSVFATVMATGPPIESPCLTPPLIETSSCSNCIRAPRPYPSRRRARESWISEV